MVMSMNNGFVYLAQPYSHPRQSVRDWRVAQGLIVTAKLMAAGLDVFSPVSHTSQLEKYLPNKLVKNHAFWMKQDIAILRHASELRVLMLPGWKKSKGVRKEIRIAKECLIKISYMELT